MLSLTNSLLVMVSLFNAGLSVLILRGPARRATNLFLGVYLAALCIWPLALIGSQVGPSYAVWLYSAKATYAAGLIIAGSFYLFSLAFPEEKSPTPITLLAVYGIVLGYIAALFTSPTFLVETIVQQGTGHGAKLDANAYLLFASIFCCFYGAGLWNIATKYQHSIGLVRRRLLVIGLGVAITGAGGFYYDILLASPFINDFRYIWTGPLFNTVTAALILYAIFRLGLLNAKAIAVEALIVLLWIFTLLRTLLAVNAWEQGSNGALFGFSLVIGALLIRAVHREMEQTAALVAANQGQERLLHFISHEVKGYLTKGAAAFDAIRTGDYDDTKKLHAVAAIALADTRMGVETITGILEAANLQRGTVAFQRQDFDLAAVLEKAVANQRQAAADKGLSLSFSSTASGPAPANGDPEKLTQHVFRNLIDNAIRYTPAGSIAVELKEEPAAYLISVSDTGVGISPEDMGRLFTEGGHGKDSTKINVHSTGYGLFIAKQVIEAHGGTIQAKSEGAGKGSQFILELPRA